MSKQRPTWSKHPLEGDDNITKLFHYLYAKNKDLESCPQVKIPETIVYEHNFPNGWYYMASNEVRKKSGKDIEPKAILQDFQSKYRRELLKSKSGAQDFGHTILAYYLSSKVNDEGDELNEVEFFTYEQLEDFFFKRKVRERGILQRFVHPKGPNNFIIQAIWSPHVMMLERRVNIHRLNDSKVFTNYERAVTYEGPSHYSNEVFCAPHLQKEIKKVCTAIVNHFASTEHKNITRMVLYFKIGIDNQLYLLWSSSIRIAHPEQKTQEKFPSLQKSAPLNLSPKFNLTMTASDTTCNTMSLLPSTMTHVDLKLNNGTSKSSNRNTLRQTDIQRTRASTRDGNVDEEVNKLERKAKTPAPLNEQSQQKLHAFSEVLENLVYEAYSHFLEGNQDPFSFTLPSLLQTSLDENQIDELLLQIHCKRSDAEANEAEGDEPKLRQYKMKKKTSSISKLQHELQEFKKDFLATYKRQLQDSQVDEV